MRLRIFFVGAFVLLWFSVGTASAETPLGEIVYTTIGSFTTIARADKPHFRPIPKVRLSMRTKVNLGRSCVGESGFAAGDECIAIAWVYANRARKAGWSFDKMMHRYSAALKPHERHRRPWLFELNAEGERPKHWPRSISWKHHNKLWQRLLTLINEWENGWIRNPLPKADHFGSRADAQRACFVRRWKRLDAPDHFRNWFFDSSRRVSLRKVSGRDWRDRSCL